MLYHNVMAPYRHALFRAIARHVELDVWFSVRTTRDRDWGKDDPQGYKYRVLNARTWYAFDRPLILSSNLIPAIREAKPDALVAVLTRSNLLDVLRLIVACRRLKVPVVLWIGNVEYVPCFTDGLPSLVTRAFEAYYRFAIRGATGFMFYSTLSEEWARARGANGPAMIGTQVLEAPNVGPRIALTDVENHPLKVLFVGKLEERKGFDLLISSIRSLEPKLRESLELVVAGSGPLGGLLTVSNVGGRFRQLGHVGRSDLWQIYKAADLLVLPSRHDPWGFVVNEAMEMGTPVLASTGCGAAELASKAGWLFDPCSEADFVARLKDALAGCRRPELRAQAAAAAANYRPDSCAESISGLLHKIFRQESR